MRINAIKSSMPYAASSKVNRVNSNSVQNNLGLRVVSLSDYMASPVSFTGARNNKQAVFYGAEVDPFSKAGGVGVVMKDYGFILDPKDEVVVSPYYRAEVDKKTGEVKPLTDKDGDYIIRTNKGDRKLNLVATNTIQWGKETDSKVMLFSLKDEEPKVHYFVFDDSTAHFSKPYENIPVYRSGAKQETNAWKGDPYAKNSKAFVELLPELIKDKPGFDPGTVVCSDSQTAYTHEYMVQRAVAKDDEYDGIKTTHVGHNLGPGYCGETSMKNMFVNLGATPEQIEIIENDPMYKDGKLGDDYFKPFVEKTLDTTGTASATQIAVHHATKKGGRDNFVKAFSVVAEDYAESIANNPQTAYNIQAKVKPLYQQGIFNGIMNPLEDSSVDPTKKLPNDLYNVECEDTNGRKFPAFELYPANATYSQMKKVKNSNKAKLLERLSAQDSTIVTGNKARPAKINPEAKGIYDGPVIRQDLIDLIKSGKGDQVPLFVSWGRIDTQKGHDISLAAFEKFAKTPEGKNAIFILGAGLDGGEESKRVEAKVTEMLKDPELQGRVVHIDGWAPAYAMSSAADAAVFTSRFEPCGLTDIEAMKYFCNPIVTNTQGFKQKNFDPRNPEEADKATSMKSKHEFDLLAKDVQLIIDAYVTGKPDAIDKVKEEFPAFRRADGTYDDQLFRDFADGYQEFRNEKLQSGEMTEEELNDWDKLSRNYDFRYKGFARALKDGILAQEISLAISDYSKLDSATKEKMFTNLKNLDTRWYGNATLHPDGKSSGDLYIEKHMMPEYTAPSEKDLIVADTEDIESVIAERQKPDIEERTEKYAASALAGVAGILLGRGIKSSAEAVDVDAVKKQVAKEFEGQIQDLNKKIADLTASNKKTALIAGLASAAGAAILAVAGTAYVMKKKQNEQGDTLVITPQQANQQANIPAPTLNQSSLSFNDFKNGLK